MHPSCRAGTSSQIAGFDSENSNSKVPAPRGLAQVVPRSGRRDRPAREYRPQGPWSGRVPQSGSFRVATAEDIVVMKAIALRARDIADIEAILDAGHELDLPRIRGL
jgi:hypothetical protein